LSGDGLAESMRFVTRSLGRADNAGRPKTNRAHVVSRTVNPGVSLSELIDADDGDVYNG
jgi:hypothetical protein